MHPSPALLAILKHILKSRGTFLKVDVNPVEGVIIGIVARETRGRVCFNMVIRGISIVGKTPRLHRGVIGSMPLSSTKEFGLLVYRLV